MSRARAVFKKLQEMKILKPMSTILETLEGIVAGTEEVTPGAPFVREHLEIKRYMSVAILALLPTFVASVIYFGWYVLAQVLVSYVVGGIIEVAFAYIRKREIEEGFLVTGLIFPLTLPPTAPLWVVAIGVAFGVFFGKEVFGGTGRNIFNPALVGRLFITIGFPGLMSARWVAPFSDAITSATPLATFKSAGTIPPYLDMLFGQVAGSTGEVFRIGIIAGGILLFVTRISGWRIPIFYIGTVAAFSAIGNFFLPETIAPPLFQLLGGSLLFGAFFMATDPVTSTGTKAGKVIFGIGCGIVTVVIRSFTGFTEGVMFSIVFMNAFAPLIDTVVINRKFPAVQA